jgi:hypothetical protein
MVFVNGINTIDGQVFLLSLFFLILYISIILIFKFIGLIFDGNVRFNKIILVALISFTLIVPIINMGKYLQVYTKEAIIKNRAKNDEVIIINIEDYITQFEENVVAADKYYSKKTVKITGKIFDTAQPKDYKPVMDASCLYYGDYTKDKLYITCYFNDIVVSDIKENDTVQIIGNYREYKYHSWNNRPQLNIIIGDCKILMHKVE